MKFIVSQNKTVAVSLDNVDRFFVIDSRIYAELMSSRQSIQIGDFESNDEAKDMLMILMEKLAGISLVECPVGFSERIEPTPEESTHLDWMTPLVKKLNGFDVVCGSTDEPAPEKPTQTGEWISVEDRLPKPWENVLIYMPHLYDRCFIGYRAYMGGTDFWWTPCTKRKEMSEATHWMPLPKLPKED